MCSRLNSRNPNAIKTNNWGCIHVDQTTSVHDSWYRQSISHKRYPIIGWNSLTYLYIIPQDELNFLNTFPLTVAHTLYVYDLIKCMYGSSFFPSLCSQPCPPPFEFLISWFFVILQLHTFRRLFVIYWHVPVSHFLLSNILYFVIPALYTVPFFLFRFVTYILFCLQFCHVSANTVGLALLTPSCFLEQNSLFLLFMVAPLDLGQIVAVKLYLNLIVEKECVTVLNMYEKGKINCLWIMKWYILKFINFVLCYRHRTMQYSLSAVRLFQSSSMWKYMGLLWVTGLVVSQESVSDLIQRCLMYKSIDIGVEIIF